MLSEFLKSHADAIGNGLLVILMAFLSAIGVRGMRQRNADSPAGETVAVTGDVVVVTSLKALTAEMGALNTNLVAQRKASEVQAHLGEEIKAEALEMNRRLEAIEKELIGQRPRSR